MTLVAPAKDVLAGYRQAGRLLWPFLVTHVLVRLFILAVLAPVTGLVLSVAVATSGQSALTDQDIAWFVLSPVGLAAALVVACLSVAGAVLDVALMTGILRTGERGTGAVIAFALRLILSRFTTLFGFALRLILRILAIAAPFLAAAGLVALLLLTDYDINFYLTARPPAFLLAAGLIAILALGLALVLLWKLSGWALALHLVMLRRTPASAAFGESASRLAGHKRRLVAGIVWWVALRLALGVVVTAVAAFLVNVVPASLGANLRLVAAATIAIVLLLSLANAVVAAWSNGALADLLNRLYGKVVSDGAAAPEAKAELAASGTGLSLSPAVVLLVAVGASIIGFAAGGALLEEVGAQRSVEIIAHRGAAGTRPENTLAAVTKAVEDGADWVEIDVQETADGEVVVAHDSDFMKVAGVNLKIWDATMERLADIDIGGWFDPAYAGERTPTLRQALEAVKGRGRMLIELKYYGYDVDLEARVVGIVDALGMAGDIAVMSLKYDGIRKMRALRPDWRYGVLAATAIGNLTGLEADFLAVNTGQVSLRLIRRAHQQGKQVYVWTVDDPVTMSRMISMGVDGLITNEPLLARRVMTARNELSTAERLALWVADQLRIKSFDLVGDESDA